MQDLDVTSALDRARLAYGRHDWTAAREGFAAAAEQGTLSVDDLASLADSAWWLGLNDEALAGFEAVFREYLSDDRRPEAARMALDTGFLWLLRGEQSIGGGWVSRGRRLLDELPDCAEKGYGLAIDVEEAVAGGRFSEAVSTAKKVQKIASQFSDPNLAAVGLVGEGMALIRQGEVRAGLAALDEAMLPVAAGQVSSDWAGNLYCQMMGICHELADIPRARVWTETTERWCDRFTSAVMFAGVCRMHRAQLRQIEGDWDRAEEEARQVCHDLADMNVFAVAESHYQIGEIRRLRHDLAGAEDAFRMAHGMGREPQPGLALLRMAQGRVAVAQASIRGALVSDSQGPLVRVPLLAAQVEIELAAGGVAPAEKAAAELERIASAFASPGIEASAAQARGAVLVALDRHVEALPVLREAIRKWQELIAPYQVARSRVLAARAALGLGDNDAADLDLEAAASLFDRLGAADDAMRVALLRSKSPVPGLTRREIEVLSNVASGQSNREVAATLFISEKTVARHLSNIFTKLGVSSRTEAAAFAFRQGLISHRRA
jgi:DNA-binding CsgD family transcriptional regulator